MKGAVSSLLGIVAAVVLSGAPVLADAELDRLVAQLRQTKYTNAVQKVYQKRLLNILPRISAGESIDTVIANANGTTALHNACGLSHVEIVRWLVKNGADTQAKTAKGASVSMCVAQPNARAINKILQSAPAKSKTTNTVDGPAPASVKGKTFRFLSPKGNTFSLTFRKGNSDILSNDIDPGYGNSIKYTRTSANTAKIEVEEWESVTTYTLIFTSPAEGVATESGYGEGEEWNETGITFSLL